MVWHTPEWLLALLAGAAAVAGALLLFRPDSDEHDEIDQ